MEPTAKLLGLPRELRDVVYELVALQQPITIILALAKVKFNRHFASSATVMLACKQMHEEYMEIVHYVALSSQFESVGIKADVVNMDFRKLISFASSLTTAERSTLGDILTITLAFNTSLTGSPPLGTMLGKWLQACSDLGISTGYVFDEKRVRVADHGQCILLRMWMGWMVEGQVAKHEVRKIEDALLAWKRR